MKTRPFSVPIRPLCRGPLALFFIFALSALSVASAATVSGLAWDDVVRNGLLESGESGIEGVTVSLLDGGNVIQTTTTDAGGNYAFTNVPAGTYSVRFDSSTNVGGVPYRASPPDTDPLDAVDSDINPFTLESAPFTVADPDSVVLDAGFAERVPTICYAVGDEQLTPGGGETDFTSLYVFNSNFSNWTLIATSQITGVEAAAYDPNLDVLYTVDNDDFGTIDLTDGTFTSIGPEIGVLDGALGPLDINDIDGMSYDPFTGVIWASERRRGGELLDLLLVIDPDTGMVISNFFGPDLDYVPIQPVFDTCINQNVHDIDDIAIDPRTADLYGISNQGGAGGMLSIINKADGTIEQLVGSFCPVDDMEALGFFNDGTFYGTTGNNGPVEDKNKFYTISKSSAAPTFVGTVDERGIDVDFEGLDCLTGGENLISGIVHVDDNCNGIQDNGETGLPGVDVQLYIDNNTNGVIDAGDPLVNTVQADANGEYTFLLAASGAFLTSIDVSTLPDGYFLTSDNVELQFFSDIRQFDPNNDFCISTPVGVAVAVVATSPDCNCPGDSIDLTVTVLNSGTKVIDGAQVQDTSGNCVFDVPFLAVGESFVSTCTIDVPAVTTSLFFDVNGTSCGTNVASATSIVVEVDSVPPTLTPPADLTIECDESTNTANTGEATAGADDCDDSPAVTFADTTVPGDCAAEFDILRVWSIADRCGNMTSATQTITVVDTTPPTFTVPPSIVIECDESTNTANTGEVTDQADNCSDPTVSFTDTLIPGICPPQLDILRVWTVTDECGNATVATQTIMVADTSPPVFTVPPDITVECDESTGTPNTGFASAEIDNCDDDPLINFSDTVVADDCPAESEILRVWTVTDSCGNSSSATQTITVVDTTPPTFTIPADVTIECDESTNTANTGTASAENDNCDTTPAVTFVDTVVPGSCPAEQEILRVWTVADDCGNASTATQTITVVDTTPPTFTVPADITVECDESTETSNTGEATAQADNCDDASDVAFADTVVPGSCPAESEILRVWTVTDDCGNASSATQTITVVDTTPPTFTPPDDVTVECDESTETSNTGEATAEADNCDTEPEVEFVDTVVPGACPAESDILRVWTVTDDCGNATSATQTITVVDTTPPTFTVPADVTIECDESTETANTGEVTAEADNCDDAPDVAFVDTVVPGSCPAESEILRVWTVTDDCGNAASATQTITIVDTTPPTFTVPADVTIECDESTETANTGEVTAEADNCDDAPDVAFVDTTVPGSCPAESEILRVWTVTDDCGNASSATQTITVVDTTPPTFTVPADVTIECDESTETANTGEVTAEADNCDDAPDVAFVDTTVPGSCPAESEILRVWTVTDDCGNTSSATQTITIVDTTPPTFTVPADVTIECDESTETANTGEVTAEADNCDDAPDVAFVDTTVPGSCPAESEILRVWTVTDDCGNASSATQTITIVDTTPPTFTVPADVTIECDESTETANTGEVTAEADNCDAAPDVAFVDTTVPGSCPAESEIFRVWTVTDDCGNASSATQTITIVDTTPPTFTVPADVTIECDESTETANTGEVTAQADNCDAAPDVAFVDTTVPGSCPAEQEILRVWTVTDDCGNASIVTQTISIVDTTPPTFTVPTDVTIECDESTNTANTGEVTAQADNCDAAPDVAFVDTIVPGSCPAESEIFRVWTVTDDCGNATSATQTIAIVDTTAPTFTVPADVTIECDESTDTANTGEVTAEADNCDAAPEVTFVDTVLPGACPAESDILRVWTVADDCGNTTVATQTITVVDTTPPTFTVPADVTIECDESTDTANTGEVTAEADNCDAAPDIAFIDTVVPGTCPAESEIIRVWTVTDDCGNGSSATQTITVVDTTAPTFTVPADVTIECDESTDTANTGDVTTEADNCDATPDVAFVDTPVPGACPSESEILRVWTVTDDCGNASSATQTITIIDSTPPVITCPTDFSVVADADCNYTLPTLNPEAASDNCGALTVTQEPPAGTVLSGIGPHTITITVTDDCGNSTPCTVRIILRCPDIAIGKTVYLGHDGGASCPGGELATGLNQAEVTYCISVTNSGATVLTDVMVNDNDLTPPLSTNLGTLALGQVVNLFVETVIDGDLVNTASTTGIPSEDDGTPLPFDPVSDDDDAAVDEINPGISIEKTVALGHGGTASCPGAELASGENGTAVTYCFEVSNTGDTALADVTVTDNDISPAFVTNIGVLAVGATVTVHVEASITADLINTAGVTGLPADPGGTPYPEQVPVTDEDDAEVDLIGPGLMLLKTVYYGHDGGASCPGTDLVSNTNTAPVTYCFEIVNTGDTYINDATVTDNDISPPFSENLGLIAPGESAVTFVERTIDGDLVNTASATAMPSDPSGNPIPGQDPLEDDDIAEVDEIAPSVAIVKSVYLGHDSGASCPGEQAVTGQNTDPVTYCFVVTNDGDTPLINVMVVDNDISPAYMMTIDFLAVGDSATLFTEVALDGDLVNVASVTGTPADESGNPIPDLPPVTDDDDAMVDEINPGISIVKSVYLGHDDAASCPGEQSVSGQMNDPVTYCFVVRNTGDTVLSSVTVTDNDLNPPVSIPVGVLGIGETTIVAIETDLVADLVNTATATGLPSDNSGTPFPEQPPVEDMDDAEVDLIGPDIAIQKTVYSGADGGASCPGSELVVGENGDDVTYCFEVTNTGDTFLNNVTITDNDLTPPVSITVGLLAPGEVAVEFVERTIDGDLLNTAGVTGTPSDETGTPLPEQPDVSDSDTAEVDEVAPAIEIEKTVYLGHDSGASCPGAQSATAQNGDPVTYCFEVTNTGDTPLADVMVTDNDLTPAVSTNVGNLAVGESITVFIETALDGDLVNTASATGTPTDDEGNPLPDVDPPTDDDDAEVDEIAPGISIVKTVALGQDGANCPGLESVQGQNGDDVTYCFAVANTGDTVLSSVTVTDNDISPPVSIDIGILPIGGSTTVFVFAQIDGDLINTASASGVPSDDEGNPLPEQPPVEDDDDAMVDEISPGVTISKTVYRGHDGGVSCPGSESVSGLDGDEVTYCFTVTNVGDTYLAGVTITDNDLSPPVSIDIGLLAPGDVVTEYVQSTLVADLVNTASVTGTPSDEEGNPLPDQPPVGDDDDAEVDLVNPSVALAKTVYLGHDGGTSCPGEELATGQSGDAVTYCFTVTNTGDTPLADVTVTDSDLSPTVTIEVGLLAVGASTTVFANSTIQGDLVNTASVTGDPADDEGNPLPDVPDPSDMDDAEVDQIGPGIQILKTVYIGHDGGASCPGTDLATGDLGDDVTYCLLVRNTGDAPLTNVEVTDEDLNTSFTVGFLPIGGSSNLIIETSLDADLVNTAEAVGTPSDDEGNPLPEQPPVRDEDDAEVNEVSPGIAITKSVTLGHNGGADCPGVQSVATTNAAAVTYCFFVENTGNTVLIDVTVTDNDIDPPVSLNLGTLPIGGSVFAHVETIVDGDLTNTASATGTPADDEGNPLPDVDPPSDNDDAVVDEISPSVSLAKSVYLGHDGGGSCPGEQSVSGQSGDEVTYCFVVSNSGDTFLTNVRVTDNDLNPPVSFVIDQLAVGETQTRFTESTIEGDLVNTASVTGTPADDEGNPIPDQPEVEDEDTAEVDDIQPGMTISKSVYLGHDSGASCPGAETVSAAPNAAITYCFVVENTGDTFLNDVTITDNDITPAVNINVGLLAPGQVVTEFVETNIAGDLTNTASATGTPSDPGGTPLPGQPPVGGSDTAVVDQGVPGVSISKTVYLGHDGGASCPGADAIFAQVGADATYCFVVVNTGDTYLNDVTITDNDLDPAVSINLGLLAPGETVTEFVESTATGDLTNRAGVNGIPSDESGTPLPGQPPVGGEDTAEVDVVSPSIGIAKTVYLGHNGGNSCPGSERVSGREGEAVTYCFVVENTGDTYLNNVTLTDNDLTPPVNVNLGLLAPGETASHFVETNFDGDLINTASTTGTPSDESGTPLPGIDPPRGMDTAEVDQTHPEIGLAKRFIAAIRNEDGTYTLRFEFNVANTGDVLLRDVLISDDVLTQFADFSPANFSTEDGSLPASPDWDGSLASNILAPGVNLDVGESGNVFASFTIVPNGATNLLNSATVFGTPPTGGPVDDTSNDGILPIPEEDDTTVIIIEFVSIGNLIWFDYNNSGTLDPGEAAASGVTVQLLDQSGNVVQTVRSDVNGFYLFDLVEPGVYSILIPPENFQPGGVLENAVSSTLTELNPDDDLDLNDNGMNVEDPGVNGIPSGPITLEPQTEPVEDNDNGSGTGSTGDDSSNLTVDFGFFVPGIIGGVVWIDLDMNGLPNENLDEESIEGATVNLFIVEDGELVFVDSMLSGENGSYLFENLPAAEFVVEIDRSTIDPMLTIITTPTSYDVNLSPGGVSLNNNFGFVPQPTAIGLASFTATQTEDGVELNWVTSWEDGTLGFYVYRLGEDGELTKVGDLVLGGIGTYQLFDSGAVGGEYVLAELTVDLQTEIQDTIAIPMVDATPVEGETGMLDVEDGGFETDATFANYLLTGVGETDQIIDVSVPGQPLRLDAKFLPGTAEDKISGAFYFSYPEGAKLEVIPQPVYKPAE